MLSPGQPPKERSHAEATPGHQGVGQDLREGFEHESTLVHAGMGNVQPRLVDHQIVVEKQVQVQRARAPTDFRLPVASTTPLNPVKEVQKFPRGHRRLDRGGGVQEWILRDGPHRQRLDECGDAKKRCRGGMTQRFDAGPEMGRPITDV